MTKILKNAETGWIAIRADGRKFDIEVEEEYGIIINGSLYTEFGNLAAPWLYTMKERKAFKIIRAYDPISGRRNMKPFHETALKPCPFCGKTAELIFETIPCGDYPDEYQYYVMCTNCFAETRHYDYPDIPNADEHAVASWNTRPIEDSLRKNIL